jgi:hypothetical protein
MLWYLPPDEGALAGGCESGFQTCYEKGPGDRFSWRIFGLSTRNKREQDLLEVQTRTSLLRRSESGRDPDPPAHNPEVAGSNPAPATSKALLRRAFCLRGDENPDWYFFLCPAVSAVALGERTSTSLESQPTPRLRGTAMFCGQPQQAQQGNGDDGEDGAHERQGYCERSDQEQDEDGNDQQRGEQDAEDRRTWRGPPVCDFPTRRANDDACPRSPAVELKNVRSPGR